jgi:hypothetical protein
VYLALLGIRSQCRKFGLPLGIVAGLIGLEWHVVQGAHDKWLHLARLEEYLPDDTVLSSALQFLLEKCCEAHIRPHFRVICSKEGLIDPLKDILAVNVERGAFLVSMIATVRAIVRNRPYRYLAFAALLTGATPFAANATSGAAKVFTGASAEIHVVRRFNEDLCQQWSVFLHAADTLRHVVLGRTLDSFSLP